MKLVRALALALAVIAAPAFAAKPLDHPATEARIASLLSGMTLEEKLGQLNQFSAGQPTGPGTGRTDYREMIAQGRIGSLLNFTGARETNELQRIALTQSRLRIPVLFGFDVIHGYRTVFPVPLGLAATWNEDLIERTAAVAAREASGDGVRWTFSPMVDIARDARWGRIVEGVGEDPHLASVMAAAYVRGYQGRSLDEPTSVAACAKHYVGYGAAEGGRDYNTTDIPERLLRDVYLPPFQAAVEAGAATLMSAFNAIDGVPASANRFTLDEVLRREWRFRGFVVSDWTSVKEVIEHGIANDGATAARKGILAGVEMDMEGGLYLNELGAEVRAGRVPMSVVDEAVRRVLRVKLALGLFDRPYVKEARRAVPLDVALARAAAEQSLVLLKNATREGAAALPIGSQVKTIALIGPLADSAPDMLGSWAGKGDARDAVTLRTALAEHAAREKLNVLYEKGTEIVGGTDAGIAAAAQAAARADLVILALGEGAGDMTGEAASRASLSLPGLQGRLLDAVSASGRPVVLILFSRPLALASVVDKADTIVQAWHPGIQAGPALVRVLTGTTNFSGRLTVSLPRSVGQLPLYYNHMNTGRPAGTVDLTRPAQGAGEKYVSRYIDELNAPLFPFGHGLSYTRFEYSPVTLSATSSSARALNAGSAALQVSVVVRNAGERDGVEVAQLYIRQRGTSVTRPVRELKGFQRIALRAGESKRVVFTLDARPFAFWNLAMQKLVEPAAVTVWIAPDARSGEGAQLTIGE